MFYIVAVFSSHTVYRCIYSLSTFSDYKSLKNLGMFKKERWRLDKKSIIDDLILYFFELIVIT